MCANPLQAHLVWALRQGFDFGKGLEGPSLLDAINDLSPERAAQRPTDSGHSIWVLVNHVAHWKETVARSLDGENVSFESQFPEPKAVTRVEWELDIQRLKMAQNRVLKHLESKADNDLERPLPDAPELTLAKVYTGLVAHDCYHAGQILKLRQLLKF